MAHTKRSLGQGSLIQKDDFQSYAIRIDLEWMNLSSKGHSGGRKALDRCGLPGLICVAGC